MSNIELRIGGKDFEGTPDNMHLYQFAGEMAMYDHVFIIREQLDNDQVRATYVFSEAPVYKQLVDHMIANSFPLHLNLREPAKPDIEAWESNNLSDLQDFVPDDWS